jgi:cyclophilin family peptidyl-prolyl cis-trans isomerase
MKYLLLTLPAALALTSCSAPATEDNNPNNYLSSNATSSATDASTSAATTDTATDASAQSTGAGAETSASGAGAKTYKVIDEAQPGMPSEAVAGLKKVKVPPPPATLKVADKQRVRLVTSKGTIVVELNPKAAPLHARSFAYLSGRKFFDGTVFHRYEPGFVIQGGDPLTKDAKLKEFYGVGGPGYQVPREFNDLKHEQFVLSAARSSDPDSAGSQFYITLAAANFLDQDQAQDGVGYTVFGKVLSGGDVVLKLRAGDKLQSATLVK